MIMYLSAYLISLICLIGSTWCCSDKWVALEASCYYFSKTQTTWIAAEAYCKSQKAVLATIDNEDEIFMASVVLHAELQYDNKAFWIGGSDREVEGVWKWISNNDVIAIDGPFWFTNQPQGGRNENCLALNPCGDSACYHDYDCSRRDMHFICEKGYINMLYQEKEKKSFEK